jgi:predicted RNA binding protein YcfA (HicA-like mRNA interferase family)
MLPKWQGGKDGPRRRCSAIPALQELAASHSRAGRETLPQDCADLYRNVASLRMRSRELIRMLEKDGWTLIRITGSHHHFKHPLKPGVVTVPHPRRDIPIGTLRSIERQANLRLH